VIHYDAAGTSRQCFKVLQDHRDLSVHFLLDVDGTLYQTLDVKERAWHAGAVNTRSVGVEIANIGAYAAGATNPLAEWYRPESNGPTALTIPARFGDGGLRTKGFLGFTARPGMITGKIHEDEFEQYDYTPEQYEALARLTAALCTALPKIECRCPTNDAGRPLPGNLSDDALAGYRGVLGHYHLDPGKVDPGPAFDWDRVIARARALMQEGFSPQVQSVMSGKRGK
jgi:N-acetyl-anhydromuramyl-L-alanine amidase AmpD